MLAVIGLAALAPPAAAVFTAPVNVASTSQPADPQVATDADGDSAFTWRTTSVDFDVFGRTMTAGGVLGPVHDLDSNTTAVENNPRVATDATGDSVFTWQRAGFVLASRLSAGGTLGPEFQVSGGSGTTIGPEIATDANGDTIFTWVNTSGFSGDRVQARTMTSRGVLGTLRNVSPAGQIGTHPQVATDASGDSVITWVREDGVDGDNDIVQARTMTRNGSLGPITDLSAPAGRAFAPQVATDADGDTIFTWLRFNGTRDRVQARTMSAAGTLGTTFSPSSVGPSDIDPQVAIDATGDSVFTWERFDTDGDRIQARTRSAAGTLGPLTTISNVDAFAPQVASDATGDSVFTWVRFDGVNDRVQAKPMTAAGAFGTTVNLSTAGADAETPQVAIAANTGAAVVTWERDGIVQASRGP
jgi:hypothetical protein